MSKNFRKIIVRGLISIVIFALLLPQNNANAATYYFKQSDWSGGATTTIAVHPTNQTGWNYFSTSTNLVTGTELKLAPIAGSVTQTSDTDFAAGTFALTTITGAGTAASVVIGRWYDPNWQYRRLLSVSNTSASNLTDYQVQVTIDTQSLISAGKMRSDCGDIRFTDSEGTTQLSYWLESGCNTASTKIWVKVPSIPAGSTKIIFLYYGNPTASSASNADNTMFIYEDFTIPPRGSLAGSATYDSTNKWVQLTPPATHLVGYLYYTKVPTNPTGFYAKFYFWAGGGNGGDAIWLGAYDTSYSGTGEDIVNGGYHFTYDEWQNRIAFTKSGTPIASAFETTVDNSQWHLAEIYFWYDGSAARTKIYYDGILKVDSYDAAVQSNVVRGMGQIIFGGRTVHYTNYHRIGNGLLYLRKYTSPEPTTNMGGETALPSSFSGIFTSSVIDTGPNFAFTTLNWSAITTAQTSIKLQLSSSADNVNWTNFVGPDGTISSYYTTPGSPIWSGHNGHRYVKYKAYLETTDTSQTPYLNDVTINYQYYYIPFEYRRLISVSNTSASNLTDYQVQVTIDTQSLISAGKMRSDCGDIRFTDSEGTTQLSYWLESGCNTASTKIWVKVPSIPAGSTKIIFLYYGNPSASSASNGDATFEFFDDFSTNTLGTKWIKDPSDGAWTVKNGYLEHVLGAQEMVVANTPTTFSNFIVEYEWTSGTVSDGGIGFRSQAPNNDNFYIYIQRNYASNHSWHRRTNDVWSSSYNARSYNWPDNIWIKTVLIVNGSSFEARNYDKATGQLLDTNSWSDTTWSSGYFLLYSTASGVNGRFDNFFVRKYASPEPTTNVGGEEMVRTLISSPYDTSDNSNVIGGISWNENVPPGTGVIVSLRSASSSSLLDSATWFDFTSTTTGCTKTATTVNCTSTAIPPTLKDGRDDRFIQYKVTLLSNGANTPTFSNFSLTYVVNAPPEFDPNFGNQGILTFQVSDPQDLLYGRVTIQYSIRDPDTTQGSVTPGYITPKFQYSLDNGNTWNDITSTYLREGDLSNKVVQEATFTVYDAVWDVKSQIPNVYTDNLLLKVIINDNEGANNLAYGVATLTIDTKPPAININYLKIDASQNQVLVKFNILDDTSTTIKYRISNNADLSYDGLNSLSQDWQNLATTSLDQAISWQFTGTYPRIYLGIQSIDQYGNTASPTISAVAPSSLGNLELKDISRPNLNLYSEFISWNVYQPTTSANFSRYEIFRSTDGTNYSLITSSTDINNFYFVDTGLDSNLTYYYKARVIDTDGDISGWSSIASDRPDGQGGTDFTPPRISNVQVAEVNATWAKIRWQTDELANSIIDYALQAATPNWMTASSSAFVFNHEIVLSNLSPSSTYIFQVRSKDVMENEAFDNNNSNYYTFTTLAGVVISNVTVRSITDTSAEIIWNTNLPANSYVVYSTDINNLRNNTSTIEIGSAEMVTQHIVKLTGLTQKTTYYYYVKSTDQYGNTTIDNNNGNFYSFVTSFDTEPPRIYDVRVPIQTSKLLVITWLTDEPADGQIEYGTQSGIYSSSTDVSLYLSTFHALTLSGLIPQTTYYFRIKSKDAMNNLAISPEYTASTTAEESKLVRETVYLGVSTEQYNQLKTEYEKLKEEAYEMKQELEKLQDKTPPEISNIEIKNVQPFSATVCFRTNEPAIGIVQFGEEKGKYPYSVSEDDYSTFHCFDLKRLKMGTKYYLRIIAVDRNGNKSIKTTK